MSQSSLYIAFRAARPRSQVSPSLFFERARATRRPASTLHRRPATTTTHPLPASQLCRKTALSSSTAAPKPRSFSTTAGARATVTRHNPRKDDDGNEMTIEISERAAEVGYTIRSMNCFATTLLTVYIAPERNHVRRSRAQHARGVPNIVRLASTGHGDLGWVSWVPVPDVVGGPVEDRRGGGYDIHCGG